VLCGGRGNDVLTGNSGADLFGGGKGRDVATDLNPADGDATDGSVP
jgi:Ca2+-binding RTX toxin-like protein